MAGPRALIVYSSKHGQTEKVANRIGTALSGAPTRALVTIRSVADVGSVSSLDAFQIVIVGCAVYAGRHAKSVGDFVTRHREALNGKRTAFFSLSLGTALFSTELHATDRTGSKAALTVRAFLDGVGWRPHHIALFAGALRYSQYGWATRMLMKGIAKRTGASTDTSRDVEYTDWEQVEAFADRIAAAAPEP